MLRDEVSQKYQDFLKVQPSIKPQLSPLKHIMKITLLGIYLNYFVHIMSTRLPLVWEFIQLIKSLGKRDMVQWLRAPAFFAWDLSSIQLIHIWQLTDNWNSSSGVFDAFLCLTQEIHVCTRIRVHIHTHIHKNNNKDTSSCCMNQTI